MDNAAADCQPPRSCSAGRAQTVFQQTAINTLPDTDTTKSDVRLGFSFRGLCMNACQPVFYIIMHIPCSRDWHVLYLKLCILSHIRIGVFVCYFIGSALSTAQSMRNALRLLLFLFFFFYIYWKFGQNACLLWLLFSPFQEFSTNTYIARKRSVVLQKDPNKLYRNFMDLAKMNRLGKFNGRARIGHTIYAG